MGLGWTWINEFKVKPMHTSQKRVISTNWNQIIAKKKSWIHIHVIHHGLDQFLFSFLKCYIIGRYPHTNLVIIHLIGDIFI
jgi:hypothetical protein